MSTWWNCNEIETKLSCRNVVFDTNLWPLLVWGSDCNKECLCAKCVGSRVICARLNILYRLNYWGSQKFSNNGVWLLEDQWIVINFFPMSLSSHCNYNWFTCILFWQKIFICIVNQHLFEYINWQKTPFTLPPIECKCWGDHWNIQPFSLEFYESKIHAGDFFFFKYS